MRSRIGISKYLNMHKSLYKFVKKRNKCDVTIKSTITKRIISERKKRGWINKKIQQKRNKFGERKRERERVWPFCHEKLRRNTGEMWKWSKKKFIRKLRWKRKDESRWKVERSDTVEFKRL